MLRLPFLLLAALPRGAGTEDATPACSTSCFRVTQTSTFANSSWAQTEVSAWLGNFKTHSWDTAEDKINFLKPWSKGNFSSEELTELEDLFRVFFMGFTRQVHNHVAEFHLEYPFMIQYSVGCQLLPGKSVRRFLRAALGGRDFLSLRNASCEPAPQGGWRAQAVCRKVVEYKGICDTIRKLLGGTCPRFLLGLLDAGKAELQRQERPEAWLSPGPSPGPGRLRLVCHVSGFYPEPLWAAWVRGEQEQPGSRPGDTLPLADGTWHLRVTLDVAAGEAAGLACRVKHSSLGGRDIVLHWDGRPLLLLLVCLSVPAALATLVVIHTWVPEHRWTRNVLCLHAAKSVFVPGASSPGLRVSEHQPSGAQGLRGKKRPWQRWRELWHQLWRHFIAPKVLPASPSTCNSCKMHGQAG